MKGSKEWFEGCVRDLAEAEAAYDEASAKYFGFDLDSGDSVDLSLFRQIKNQYDDTLKEVDVQRARMSKFILKHLDEIKIG